MTVTEHFVLEGEYLGSRFVSTEGTGSARYLLNVILYCPKCGKVWGRHWYETFPEQNELFADRPWTTTGYYCLDCNEHDGGAYLMYWCGGRVNEDEYHTYPQALLLRELYLVARRIEEGKWEVYKTLKGDSDE